MQFKKINLRPKSLLFKKVNGTSTLVEYKDGIVNKWFLKGLLILSSLYQGRGYNTGIILWSWSQNRDRDWDIREHFKIVVFQNCRRVKSIQIQSFFWSVFSPFRTEYGPKKLWIWSHLLQKSLMENLIFCAAFDICFCVIFGCCDQSFDYMTGLGIRLWLHQILRFT